MKLIIEVEIIGGIVMGNVPKYARILDIYIRLCEGNALNQKEEAERFGNE